MKINGKHISENIDFNDGRVGWNYRVNAEEFKEACNKFFAKRKMKYKYDKCSVQPATNEPK